MSYKFKITRGNAILNFSEEYCQSRCELIESESFARVLKGFIHDCKRKENTIYTYLKDYKIHRALHLLEETNKNISEIAGIVGYDNSSKFAKVFKDKLGCSPVEYRKQKVHLEHQRLFGVEIKE